MAIDLNSYQNGYNIYTVVLTSGQSFTLYCNPGTFYRVLSASGKVGIGANDQQPQEIPAGCGVKLPDAMVFDRLTVKDLSAGSNTVVLAVSLGLVLDDRLTLSSTVTTQEVRLATGIENAAASVTVTGGLISTGTAASRRLHIRNRGPFPVRVGSDSTAANNQLELQPGEFLTTEFGGSLYGIAQGGTTTVEVFRIGV